MLLAAATSVLWAVQSFSVKRTVNAGITRRDYFFYCCVFIIPFAAVIQIFTPFYFKFGYELAILFAVSIVLRYGKMATEVSTIQFLAPFESEAYMCLGVVWAYIIDCVFRIKAFSAIGVISLFIVLLGVFLIADIKLQIRKLRVNLLLRIFCDVTLGYITRLALIYCSNAMYILTLNVLIVLIFAWQYKWSYHRGNGRIVKLIIIQQTLGIFCLFMGNFAAQQSITTYAFIRPLALTLCVIISFFYNKRANRDGRAELRQPKVRDAVAVGCIVAGICLHSL